VARIRSTHGLPSFLETSCSGLGTPSSRPGGSDIQANAAPGTRTPELYEEYQAWPPDVAIAVARYMLSPSGQGPKRCLVLGCATGVNDALPLARTAKPRDRVIAGDIDPAFLERLGNRVRSEGLSNVEVRKIDITQDLSDLGAFDLVSLLFVVHRLGAWRPTLDRLIRLVAPGGSFFISEFAGPEGIIYLSNESGGARNDPVSLLIRRYFELLPQRFDPALKSTSIGPVLRRIEKRLVPCGHRDFVWKQSITPAEMLRRMSHRAYAPYFSTDPPPNLLHRLGEEFSSQAASVVSLEETIRIYRFEGPRA
jgi:SAM-dependent methyltransferase